MQDQRDILNTRHFNKSCLSSREAVCACGWQGNLESYDCRIWLCFETLPVVPLYRAHVTDFCPKCERSQEMSLKKWKQMAARVINEAISLVQKEPQNRRLVLEAFETARPYAVAGPNHELATLIEAHWHNDPEILNGTAELYMRNNYLPDAERVFRILVSKFNDLEAREDLALMMLKQRRPEDAWSLLNQFVVERRVEKTPVLLRAVQYYQDQGAHDEALDLLNACLRAFPEIADRSDYQARRRASEQHRPFRPAPTKLP